MTVAMQMIRDLFERLEQISNEHEELTDTEVREALHLALNYYFVWGKDASQLPCNFGMFSQEGNRLVRDAVQHFLEAVNKSPELKMISYGQARLDALQSGEIRTSDGRLYDEFIGHRDVPLPPEPLPEQMFIEDESYD